MGKQSGGSITDYYGRIEYKDGNLEAIYHDDGRIIANENGGFDFEYFIKDYLGNTRVTFKDKDGNGKISVKEDDDEFYKNNIRLMT